MSVPPVLLIHGWGGSADSTWGASGWIGDFAWHRRRSIAVDLPGHGSGPVSRLAEDYSNLAGDVAKGLPDCIVDVIGFSLGAKIALDLACHMPGRFRRIVVLGIGDNCFAAEPAREDVANALDHGLNPGDPPHVQTLVAYSRASLSDPKALAAVLRRAPNPVLEADRLRNITAKTMLINGGSDTIALPDGRLRTALRGVEYRALAGLDHIQTPSDHRVRKMATDFVIAEPTALVASVQPCAS